MYSVTESVVHFISNHQLTWAIFKEHYFLWTMGIIFILTFLSSLAQLWMVVLFISIVVGGITSGIVGIFVALFDDRKLGFWTRYIQDLEPTFYHVNDVIWLLVIIYCIFECAKGKKNKEEKD